MAYRAPHIKYAPDSTPGDRLSTLLRELPLDPSELMVEGTDVAWMRRLASYTLARNRFIEPATVGAERRGWAVGIGPS